MPERGFPELLQHYKMLGAIKNVSHAALLQFPHNYNYVSRATMYHWLNSHLNLGFEEPIIESSYNRLSQKELSVWNDQHPRPKCVPDFEIRLLNWLTSNARKQIAGLAPHDRKSLQRYRRVVGGAWDILLRSLPESPEIRFEPVKYNDKGKYRETLGLLHYRSVEDHRATLPMVVLKPKKATRKTVLWTEEQGKSGLYTSDGSIKSHIQSLLNEGVIVVGVDLLYQGEFLTDGQSKKQQRWLTGEEAFAGWTYCYNLPLFARRVHDILAVIELLRHNNSKTNQVDVVGLNGTGPLVAAAVAKTQGTIAHVAIDTEGFRFADLTDVYDVNFVPGAAKYNDLPGVLALIAPTKLWLAGEGKEAPSIVRAAFNSAGEGKNLTTYAGETEYVEKAVVEWLLTQ
jgi:hypothetical protein